MSLQFSFESKSFYGTARKPFIDCEGTIFFELDPEAKIVEIVAVPSHINTVPEPVYNQRIRRFPVPDMHRISTAQVRRLYKRLEPLFEEVIAGHEVRWNGHSNIGYLSPAGEKAWKQIRCILANYDAKQELAERKASKQH